MKLKNPTIILLVITVILLGITVVSLKSKPNLQPAAEKKEVSSDISTSTNCLADDCLAPDLNYPVSSLPVEIEDVLTRALMDEYKAYATYIAIQNKFGNIRPFIMIARAENQHINALQSIFEKYDLPIPQNTFMNAITVPDTLQQSCAAGVQAEIDNVKLYKETLLPKVTAYEDITKVFTNLMNASEQKHLPAFQRCD